MCWYRICRDVPWMKMELGREESRHGVDIDGDSYVTGTHKLYTLLGKCKQFYKTMLTDLCFNGLCGLTRVKYQWKGISIGQHCWNNRPLHLYNV